MADMAGISQISDQRIHKNAMELYAALKRLLADTQHVEHDCGGEPGHCPVVNARELINDLEGRVNVR